MTYRKLKILIMRHAEYRKECSAYSGSCGDGGYTRWVNLLTELKHSITIKKDLRPSEWEDEIEVGEPIEFNDIFKDERKELARNIKL